MVNNNFLKSLNILYVEDEIETAKKFSSILRKIFNEVHYAPNGKEALEIFNQKNVNIVISDINMPIMDGLAMSREIRATDKTTPILLITARNETEALLEAIELNVDSYILKPISLDDFIDKIFSVSERIQAKQNQKLLDQYKMVVDQSSIVMKFDLDGKISYVNDNYTNISGFTQEEVFGNFFNFNQHKSGSSSLYLNLWETLQDKKSWFGKQINHKKNQNEYIVETRIVPILDVNDNLKEFISVSTDITDQETLNKFLKFELKNYKDNLSDKTQLLNEYQKSFDQSTSLAKLDKEFKILSVNSKFLKITGLSRRDLVNKNLFEFIKTAENNCFELLEKLENKEFAEQIITLNFDNKNNKSIKHINFCFSPILDVKDDIAEFLLIGTDLTETIELQKEIEETQKDLILTLANVGEKRSKETGNHVKRVANYSYLIAKKYGLSEEEANLVKMAAPMHDIGKIGIPDSILHKEGKLTKEEFTIMKTHPSIGFEMLKNSERKLLKASAIIAHEHHEKWNGTGYPRGLKADEIHIYGRIVGVADVFDALESSRCYKNAWEDNEVLEYMKEKAGIEFDPTIVKILVENIDDFLKIKEKFKDPENKHGEVA